MTDLYEILGITKQEVNAAGINAVNIVQKAFRKKAIIFHPDKRNGDREKFEEAKFACDVLSDAKKRRRYDEDGMTDDLASEWNSKDVRGPSVTKEELLAFKKEYQGSQEEIDDIVQLYNEGCSLADLAEQMWFGHMDEEARYVVIINAQIDAGNIERVDAFFVPESKVNKSKRKRRADKEAKEAEELAQQLASRGSALLAEPSAGGDLVSLIQSRNAARVAGFDAFEAKWAKRADEEAAAAKEKRGARAKR